jgi:hypothetical protein
MAIINGRGRVGARITSGGGAPSYDPDAQAFFTAASITDTTQMGAVNTLVTGLKSNNLWTKMKAIYPVVGGNATAHSKNLVNTSLYQLSFSSGWTHSSTGMLPNGTSAYANTGLNTSTVLNENSSHYSIYLNTNTDGLYIDLGNRDADSENIFIPKNGSNTLINVNTTYGSRISVSNTDSRGLYVLSRTTSNLMTYFKNNSKITTSSASSGSVNGNLYLSAWNDNSSPNYFSNRNISICTIGDGLSDTEATNLSTIVNTFNTTLGRNTY